MKDKIENIEELQKAMWELRLCAEEITQSAKAGEFLTEQLFAKTSEKLRKLQELQEECKEVFFQDGFVVGSINDMRTALEEYEKKKNREALADVKKVFMDFMRICSDQEKPEQALEKIRGKLTGLTDEDILNMSPETVYPYRELYAFVKGGSEEQDIVQKLYGKFDPEIVLAAAAKWLYVREVSAAKEYPGVRILRNCVPIIVEKEDKPIKGTKAFLNDLSEKKLSAAVVMIVRSICFYGSFPGAKEEDVPEKRAQEYLFSKGLLQKFYPQGKEGEARYCLTENGEKLFRQQSCAELLFRRRSIAFPPVITEYAGWAQMRDCATFLRAFEEKTDWDNVATAFFERRSILCAWGKLECEKPHRRFETIFFPNEIDVSQMQDLEEFFGKLKEELDQKQKYVFILADDKDAATELYKKMLAGVSVAEYVCGKDAEELRVKAEERIDKIIAGDLAGEDAAQGVDGEGAFAEARPESEKEVTLAEAEVAEETDEAFAEENEANAVKEIIESEEKDDAAEQESVPAAEAESLPTFADCIDREESPSDDEFRKYIAEILNKKAESDEELKNAVVNAVLLAYAAELEKDMPRSAMLSAQLRQATNLMADESMYTSEKLSDSFQDPGTDDPVLKFAAFVFAMLRSAEAYDYRFKNQVSDLFQNYDAYFEPLPQFKKLFNEMLQARKQIDGGFTPAVVALLGNEKETRRFEKSIRDDAAANMTVSFPDIRLKEIPALYNKCFGKGGDFYDCLELISKKDFTETDVEIVKDFFTNYTRQDSYDIDPEKIGEKVDSVWKSLNQSIKLQYKARALTVKQFNTRLEIVKSWLEHIEAKKDNIEKLRKYKGQIIKTVTELLAEYDSWKDIYNSNVLLWMLNYIRDYLDGTTDNLKTYSHLLFTGVIGVGGDGLPLLGADMAGVKFYEPWRNVMKMIVTPERTPEELQDEILGNDASANGAESLKDNLHQLEMLGKYLGSDEEIFTVTEEQIREAESSAEYEEKKFRDVLELAYTYNRINENEKERIDGTIKQFKDVFYAARDFALWRRFLGALRRQIDNLTHEAKTKLMEEMKERRKRSDSPLLERAAKLIAEDENFAVAEELINRVEAGEKEFDVETETLSERDYFAEFLDKATYEPLYRTCRAKSGQQLSQFGLKYIKEKFSSEWTSRSKNDSESMVKVWPGGKGGVAPEQIKQLVGHLGLRVTAAEKEGKSGANPERFRLNVVPAAKSLPDYSHPIAAFGTQIKSPLNVVVLYGKHSAGQLMDTISRLNPGGISIVLMDYFLTEAERRQIGEEFHKRSGMNPFLLVDQVLFLYLAKLDNAERLPALLKCALPYTIYQPFNMDGGSTADEMFFGRQSELRTIMNLGGACVVYGGRQLGKTALLERVESLCAKPEEKKYAVYVSIHSKSAEGEIAAVLTEAIEKKTEKQLRLGNCATLKELCDKLAVLYRRGGFVTMYLLIDEVDAFLAAIAEEKYMTLQPLNDLRRETKNNFKFVIAGTHNVCRAQNATAENGIFGQLGTPLCIKPLSPMDALKLLSRPLSYLGFRIGKAHLETILTNTNYYPGILQYFGYKLVDTLTTDYAKYYSASKGNPPFLLVDEQLGRVMSSSDLNESIKEKFRLSLKLDRRYYMIARCLTMCYHMNDGRFSFSVEEIREMAELYDIHCLEKETKDSFVVLLDEMVDMGILIKSKEGEYHLRKNSFVDIIGNDMYELDKEINESNREV